MWSWKHSLLKPGRKESEERVEKRKDGLPSACILPGTGCSLLSALPTPVTDSPTLGKAFCAPSWHLTRSSISDQSVPYFTQPSLNCLRTRVPSESALLPANRRRFQGPSSRSPSPQLTSRLTFEQALPSWGRGGGGTFYLLMSLHLGRGLSYQLVLYTEQVSSGPTTSLASLGVCASS